MKYIKEIINLGEKTINIYFDMKISVYYIKEQVISLIREAFKDCKQRGEINIFCTQLTGRIQLDIIMDKIYRLNLESKTTIIIIFTGANNTNPNSYQETYRTYFEVYNIPKKHVYAVNFWLNDIKTPDQFKEISKMICETGRTYETFAGTKKTIKSGEKTINIYFDQEYAFNKIGKGIIYNINDAFKDCKQNKEINIYCTIVRGIENYDTYVKKVDKEGLKKEEVILILFYAINNGVLKNITTYNNHGFEPKHIYTVNYWLNNIKTPEQFDKIRRDLNC